MYHNCKFKFLPDDGGRCRPCYSSLGENWSLLLLFHGNPSPKCLQLYFCNPLKHKAPDLKQKRKEEHPKQVVTAECPEGTSLSVQLEFVYLTYFTVLLSEKKHSNASRLLSFINLCFNIDQRPPGRKSFIPCEYLHPILTCDVEKHGARRGKQQLCNSGKLVSELCEFCYKMQKLLQRACTLVHACRRCYAVFTAVTDS